MDLQPIHLDGINLGLRHQQLNKLVNEAYNSNVPFKHVKGQDEKSDIDKLFKIDVANKYKNVDYILESLRDEDMIFVCRAMKCKWLVTDLKYSEFINPHYLEDKLFPEMKKSAVSKMKLWIRLNLKDEIRCQLFYEYYKSIETSYALSFLPKCSSDFIIKHMEAFPEKITPQYLKLLCEKTPKAAEMYFKTFIKQENVLVVYTKGKNDQNFLKEMKILLKSDPDTYFYIIENFYEKSFKRLSPDATKYIMQNHKDKYLAKPELYAAWLLDTKVLASTMNETEAKELVLKLARAEYIDDWFNYKNSEPFLKQLGKDDKQNFCKKIFVEKTVGEKIKTPPYPFPLPPKQTRFDNLGYDSCLDNVEIIDSHSGFRRMKISKKKSRYCAYSACMPCIKKKTLLDELFDTYRFSTFEETFSELTKKITIETSAVNRQYMALVLVSKTGGHEKAVEALLKYLVTRHSNETTTWRATIIRSLVKRSQAWRLSDSTWELMLKLARDLGLDGSQSKTACSEGIHAAIIRDALNEHETLPALRDAYLRNFSTLQDSGLNKDEKTKVINHLKKMLLSSAKDNKSTEPLDRLLDLKAAYMLNANDFSSAKSILVSAAREDSKESKQLLRRLFDARLYRRELFKETFALLQDEASYLNVLKHDSTIFHSCQDFNKLLEQESIKLDKFFQKVSLYFDDELKKIFVKAFEQRITLEKSSGSGILKGYATIAGNSVWNMIQQLNEHGGVSKRMAIDLSRVLHLVKPNFRTFDIQKFGVNSFATWLHTASDARILSDMDTMRNYKKALLLLSLRPTPGLLAETAQLFNTPTSKLLYAALRSLRILGEKITTKDWEVFKKLIHEVDLKNKKKLQKYLSNMQGLPKALDYCLIVTSAFVKLGVGTETGLRYKDLYTQLCYIHNNIHKLDAAQVKIVEEIVITILQKDFTEDNLKTDDNYKIVLFINVLIKIVARLLLLCETEEHQKMTFDKIGRPFLEIIENHWDLRSKSSYNSKFLVREYFSKDFISALKYNRAFQNKNLVSPMPTFEMILSFIKNFLPMEQYFTIYCNLHLTMTFYKATRQSFMQKPDLFDGKVTKEAYSLIAFVFGKYLAQETLELISRYFVTIRQMFAEEIINYIRNDITTHEMRDSIVGSVINGLIENRKNTNGIIVGVFLYKNMIGSYYIEENDFIKNIQKELNSINEAEVKYFLECQWD